MSWFKKLFSSPGSSSSQTPPVKFIKVTDKKDNEDSSKKEEPDTNNESEQSTQEIDQTQESSCYSWSGATSLFDSQGENVNGMTTTRKKKRNLGGNHLNSNLRHKNQHRNQPKLAALS